MIEDLHRGMAVVSRKLGLGKGKYRGNEGRRLRHPSFGIFPTQGASETSGREMGSALCSQGRGDFWPPVMKSFREACAEGGPHSVVSQPSASNGDFQTESLTHALS